MASKNASGKSVDAVIKLKPLNKKYFEVTIVGVTPLIFHCWSEKPKKEMREKKTLGKKTRERVVAVPEEEAELTTYRLSDGSVAFPVTGIKSAIRDAAHKDLGIAKNLIDRGLFVRADEGFLVRVNTPGLKMREDMVRVGVSRAADLRWRNEAQEWSIKLRLEYDADWLQPETIVNLIQRAGFGIGIGEWRPEKSGDFGRFEVKQG